MFGLDPDTIRNIKQAIAKIPDIDKAILYGSRAKGNYRNGSDIDITLLGKNLTLNNSVYPLMDALEELYLPYMFDISIFSNIDNENLIEHIHQVGKVFYQREKKLPKGWVVRGFESCLEKVVYTKKIKRTEFLENGEYPVISQEQEFVNGYWNNSDDLFSIKKPVVIFGDHTQVIKYIDFNFVLGADGVKILQPKNEIEARYFYYYLKNINLGNLGYARHYRLLKKLEIHYPQSLKEQKRIVAILDQAFTAINKVKANTEQNLKNTRELFQSQLQTEFANGKLKIKSGEWQEKRLGDVCEYDKKKNTQTDLPYVGLEHIESNTGKFIGSKDPFQVKSSTFYFSGRHILYGRLRPYLNKVLAPDFSGHCSTEIFPIKVNKLIIRKFLFYWLITNNTVDKINATWTGTRMPRANMPAVINFSIFVPSIEKQNLIVKKLDALVAETKKLETIYQQKITDLDELKKSILQQAFNGEL